MASALPRGARHLPFLVLSGLTTGALAATNSYAALFALLPLIVLVRTQPLGMALPLAVVVHAIAVVLAALGTVDTAAPTVSVALCQGLALVPVLLVDRHVHRQLPNAAWIAAPAALVVVERLAEGSVFGGASLGASLGNTASFAVVNTVLGPSSSTFIAAAFAAGVAGVAVWGMGPVRDPQPQEQREVGIRLGVTVGSLLVVAGFVVGGLRAWLADAPAAAFLSPDAVPFACAAALPAFLIASEVARARRRQKAPAPETLT